MKITFLILEGKPPVWVEKARSDYEAKLKPFVNFTIRPLKSPSAERESAIEKSRKEGDLILKIIEDKDLLILFDEGGKTVASSEEFAKMVGRVIESGKANVYFVIGGPYGFSPEVRSRAQFTWSLSKLTMNHWVAQIAALEQQYRAMTLIRGIPYHNR